MSHIFNFYQRNKILLPHFIGLTAVLTAINAVLTKVLLKLIVGFMNIVNLISLSGGIITNPKR